MWTIPALRPIHLVLAFSAGIGCLAFPTGSGWNVALCSAVAGLLVAGCSVGREFPWPSGGWAEIFPAGCVLLCSQLLLVAAAGYGYGFWRMERALDDRIPQCSDVGLRRFELTVLDDPVAEEVPGRIGNGRPQPVSRFLGRVRLDPDPDCPELGLHRLRLSWYDAPPLQRGQRWAAEGKLRPPWGYRNPGGFDYERWLLGAGINGTGYVRSGDLLEDRDPVPEDGFRTRLKHWLDSLDVRHAGLILALMIGDDALISQPQWTALRASGTIHLLVVSGLHIGFIAGVLYFLSRWLVRLWVPLLLWIPACRLAAAAAVFASGCYVVLSGIGLPGLRAWLMSSAVLLGLCVGRRVSVLRSLGWIFSLLLIFDPLVVHQQGFWLSFAAVFALLWFFTPRQYLRPIPGTHRLVQSLVQFGQVQLILLFALSPLLASMQAAVPLHSPLANFIAVPLIMFVVLPLVLVGGCLVSFLPGPAEALILIADQALGVVMQVVYSAATVEPIPMTFDAPLAWMLVPLALLILSRAPAPGKLLLAAGLWFGVLLPQPSRPMPGHYRVTALDVGQGSAILIDTERHRLLFDAGPAYPSGFSLAETVVIPSYLKAGRQPLDGLILSHADADHTGGAGLIQQALKPVRQWRSFDATDLPAATPCSSGTGWLWDDVQFTFLKPRGPHPSGDNDNSCVLLVEGNGVRTLLAGDISARVERRLDLGSVDLLFAPHHGSRTSSSQTFIRALQPALVFISAPRRSRYGHPHPEVVERWRSAGARVHVTGWHGALQWQSSRPSEVRRWREQESGYWHSRPINR